MLSVIDFRTLMLPPTATYGQRCILFIPADPSSPGFDGRMGNVSIRLQRAKSGVHRVFEIDTYAVEETADHNAPPGSRVFWFVNLTDRSQTEPYEVWVGPNSKCSCKAGKCRVPGDPPNTEGCKHRDSVIALIEEEII